MSPRLASSAPPTLVRLDPRGGAALHRQIYDSLRDAVVAGRLAAGSRVPATRVLAAELGVSRNTVTTAIEQLRAEGYVEARSRSGVFVARTLPEVVQRVVPSRRPAAPRAVRGEAPGPSLSGRGAELAALRAAPGYRPASERAFRAGFPALDAFPWAIWSRLVARRLRGGMRAIGGYGAPLGHGPLREAIAASVAASRGATCAAEQVVVTSGAQQALDLAARLLVGPGDTAWVEDPGYLGARATLAAAGARVVPVPLDAEGLDVAEAMRRAPDARIAYVTPSHQYPTGVVMTAARRLEVLQWAARAGAWVLEDDYDSEFRYASRPLACLQGLDPSPGSGQAGGQHVLYVGTFSKTLFPALRLGYLIVPPSLVDAFAAARAVADRHSPSLDQAVLADFIEEGHFARHVRRMRVLYEERRDVLLSVGAELFGDRLVLGRADAGMHVLGHLPVGVDDAAVSARATASGVDAPALSSYAIEPLARGGLVLGYAAFTPRAIRTAARKLVDVLDVSASRASRSTG